MSQIQQRMKKMTVHFSNPCPPFLKETTTKKKSGGFIYEKVEYKETLFFFVVLIKTLFN